MPPPFIKYIKIKSYQKRFLATPFAVGAWIPWGHKQWDLLQNRRKKWVGGHRTCLLLITTYEKSEEVPRKLGDLTSGWDNRRRNAHFERPPEISYGKGSQSPRWVHDARVAFIFIALASSGKIICHSGQHQGIWLLALGACDISLLWSEKAFRKESDMASCIFQWQGLCLSSQPRWVTQH